MKNKQITWAKTILISYNKLGTLCDAIDKLVEKTASSSFYSGGTWNEENSVYNVSKKLLNLNNKKIDYINLKVVTEKSLQLMSEKHAKILILKYIKGLDNEEINKLLNIKERTMYRKINTAILEFIQKMTELGYTTEKVELIYLNDKYISSIFRSISKMNASEILKVNKVSDGVLLECCLNGFNYSVI